MEFIEKNRNINNENITPSPTTPEPAGSLGSTGKENPKFPSKTLLTIFGAFFGIAVLSAAGFFAYEKFIVPKWGSLNKPIEENNYQSPNLKSEDNAVKEFENPINGVMYSREKYESFKDRRPLAVMVNNHILARPQSGINSADIVFEAVAEGGITRLMPIFYANDAKKVGSVRSARVHYIDLAAEFYAWYAHWGGAYAPTKSDGTKDYTETNPKADAYQHINDVSLASLDQMWLGASAYYKENNPNIPTEHQGFSSTQALWREGPNKYPEEGWTKFVKFRTWKFKNDANPSDRGYITDIKFNFWDDPNFEVIWKYDKNTNSYTRYQGGVKIIDALDNKDTIAKDVIVQFTKETSAEDKKNHLLYDIVGSGTAKVFMDGKVINTTWSKKAIRERTLYFDESGNEISFNRGQIWVEIVPDRNIDSLSFITQ